VPLRKIIPIAFITMLLIVLYHSVVAELLYDWQNNPDYSHGYFIPFIAGYMAWSRREDLKNTAWKPNNWGIALFLMGIIQLMLGIIGAENFLQSTSLIIVMLGIILFLAGFKIARILLVPTLFLLFMIPLPAIIWKNFAFSLRLFASKIAVSFMHLIGMPVLREGNIIFLPGASLEVVDACSGMRSLVSLLAMSALFAFIMNQRMWKKWVLFLSAVPIAIISNIIRLIITVTLTQVYGEKAALGVTHTYSGIATFSIGLVLLLIISKLLSLNDQSVIADHPSSS